MAKTVDRLRQRLRALTGFHYTSTQRLELVVWSSALFALHLCNLNRALALSTRELVWAATSVYAWFALVVALVALIIHGTQHPYVMMTAAILLPPAAYCCWTDHVGRDAYAGFVAGFADTPNYLAQPGGACLFLFGSLRMVLILRRAMHRKHAAEVAQ